MAPPRLPAALAALLLSESLSACAVARQQVARSVGLLGAEVTEVG